MAFFNTCTLRAVTGHECFVAVVLFRKSKFHFKLFYNDATGGHLWYQSKD